MEADSSKQRRSSRVFMRVPVRAKGVDKVGRKFRNNCQTIVINAHGGLIYLGESVDVGADISLVNPITDEQQECRVVYVGETSDKGTRVGVEFLVPSPQFWGVEFAAPDWTAPPTPAQA